MLTLMTSPQCYHGSVKALSTLSLTSGSNRAFWPVCQTLNLCRSVSPAGSATEESTRTAASPEEYYRCTVFMPFMDHVLNDLQVFHRPHNRAVYCLSTITPAFVNQYAFDALLPAVKMYQAFIDESRQAPSRARAVEAMLACCSRTIQDRTGCIHSMQCIPVSKPNHPAAGARHFTHHHCHARAFLFHSQTVVNGSEHLTSLALIHVHAQTMPIEPGD